MWSGLRNIVGGSIARVGQALNLPEWGISEAVAGQPYQASATPTFQTWEPRATVGGSETYTPLYGTQPAGQVRGTSTAPTGGGGQAAPPGGGMPTEPTPSQPSEADLLAQLQARIQPALNELAAEETRAKASSEEIIKSIQSTGEAARGKVTTQEKAGETEVARQRRETETTGESAISEARRGFSEIQRGLMSRFGAGVSTGLGAISHLGAETMRNIANIRTGMQESMTRINERANEIKDIAAQGIREADAWVEQQVAGARSELNEILSAIGREKTALQSQKYQWVQDALNRYRDTVEGINARNAAFKQDVYKLQMDIDARAKQAAQNIAASAAQIEKFTVQPGQTAFFPQQQMAGVTQETLPAGFQVGTTGQYGWLTAPEKKEEDLY